MRRILKKISFQLFKLCSRLGIYILPAHYYVPIANVNQLETTKEMWAERSDLPGIRTNPNGQVQLLREVCLPFRDEYTSNSTYLKAVKENSGPGYGYIEAQALHGFIRYYRPNRIIEVGCGVSTFCMLHALEMNKQKHNHSFQLTCIEPNPGKKLKKLDKIDLIDKPVQSLPTDSFSRLNRGDFLFIDSSHTVRPGSDVNFLILEVLPRLSSGVLVHFHDIFFPFDYPRNILSSYYQWMETSLLRAFLVNNNRAKILFCLSQLHYDHPDRLKEIFPNYVRAQDENGLETEKNIDPDQKHFPASIYIEIS